MRKTEDMTFQQVQQLTPEQVVSVYSGKPGCACGCRGNYRYNPLHLAYSAERRGYAIDAEEVNYTQIKRVLSIVQQFLIEDAPDQFGPFFASVEIKGRVYTMFVKEN